MQEIFPAHYESVGGCFSEVMSFYLFIWFMLSIRPKASHIRIIIMWHVYVTNKCNYKRPLFLVTIVMSLRFCTCIYCPASASFIQYKVRRGTFDEQIKVTQVKLLSVFNSWM